MIFDFSCLTLHEKFQHAGYAVAGSLACLYFFAGLSAMGALLLRAPNYSVEQSLAGWAVAAFFMTLLGILVPHSLLAGFVTILTACTITLGAAWRRGYFKSNTWLFLLSAGFLFTLAINLYGIGKWDDFSHWVPNALYLWQNDTLPAPDAPAPHSVWPGYPYAVPFLAYLASKLCGGFMVTGGAMFNFMFLLGFACSLPGWFVPARQPTWFMLLTGLLGVTLLNPSFNASFTMTSQGDTPTMIVVATLVVLIARSRPYANKTDHILFALLSVLLMLIKQANIGIFILILCGWALVAALQKELRKSLPAIGFCAAAAMAARMIWQHYVSTHMDGNGFNVQPLSLWRWDLAPALLTAMGQTMLKKCGSFALFLALIALGGHALLRRQATNRYFLIVSACVAGGYLAFLFTCYLGTTFNEAEIRSAASFYRYSTHLGLLPIAMFWLLAPSFLNRPQVQRVISNRLATQVIRGIIVAALPAAFVISPTALFALPNKIVCAQRLEAQNLALHLGNNSRIAIFEPDGDGFFSYLMNFELALSEDSQHHGRYAIGGTNRFSAEAPDEQLTKLALKNPDLRYAYMQKAAPRTATLQNINNDKAILLVRNGEDWKRVDMTEPSP